MNHPTHDELTAFLYDDELDPPRRADVARHVDSCAVCRATLDEWRGVRAQLASWRLPPAVRVAPAMPAAARAGLRWAVAAAVLLGTGFGIARVTEKPLDVSTLRADLVREVRQEVRQELAAELKNYAVQQAQWQTGFQDDVITVIRQQNANHAILRKDVETVALRTKEEIEWLAGAVQVKPAMLPTAQ